MPARDASKYATTNRAPFRETEQLGATTNFTGRLFSCLMPIFLAAGKNGNVDKRQVRIARPRGNDEEAADDGREQ